MAEHLTVNQVVAGSSPAFGANKKDTKSVSFFVGPIGREPNLKVGSTHWCHQSRIVNYHRTTKRCARHFPCFVRFHSLKTIINHFQLRYPAFGAKRTPWALTMKTWLQLDSFKNELSEVGRRPSKTIEYRFTTGGN